LALDIWMLSRPTRSRWTEHGGPINHGTTPVNVRISAAANDSGSISQNYAAGSSLQVLVQTAAADSSASPADANVTVQFKMQ
jgi:hypothetical protein